MITEQEFLNAKKIIQDYKEQQKTAPKIKKNKRLLLLSKSNDEIKGLLSDFFTESKFLRFTRMVGCIQNCYNQKLNSKIGRNNAIIILDSLIEKNVIVVKGDYGFSEYYLNN